MTFTLSLGDMLMIMGGFSSIMAGICAFLVWAVRLVVTNAVLKAMNDSQKEYMTKDACKSIRKECHDHLNSMLMKGHA